MSNVVLITGASRYLGGRLAAQLAVDPAVDRVIGVDTIPPRREDVARLGRTEFVRADIRNPLIVKVLAQANVDTVVHAAVSSAQRALGRGPTKEMNVIGTMQLLAACQKSDTVSRVVVKSTTAIYGSSPADPAVFTEQMHFGGRSARGFAADAIEVEGYVRGFVRRRADISVSVLRFANLIGPTVDSALTRYLSRPMLPTSLGFDPRVQLVHESDAVEVMRLATTSDRPGTVNVAGSGALLLSQIVRRAGRLRLPVPGPAITLVAGLVRNSGVVEFTAEEAGLLNYGRVVDTERLRTVFGYTPRYSTADALQSFLDERPGWPRLGVSALAVAGRLLPVLRPALSTWTA